MQANDEDEIDELFADVTVVPAKKRKATSSKATGRQAAPTTLTTTVHDDDGNCDDVSKPVKKWKLF
jgi:hypothetical protein